MLPSDFGAIGGLVGLAARLRQKVLDLHGPLIDRVVERRARQGHADATAFLDGVLD